MVGGTASAQDWNVGVGGFFTQTMSYVDVSGEVDDAAGVDFDGIKLHTSAEIHFTPSIVLDNGMTFGANVEMEAHNDGGGAYGIDETYMFISSDTLGRVVIGHENSAGYALSVGAPSVGAMGINSPSISMYQPLIDEGALGLGEDGVFATPFSRQAFGSSFTEVGGNNDAARISYFTPSFSGLTVGVSYAPNGNGDVVNNGVFNTAADNALTDIMDIGVNYSMSMGTTDITLSARYGQGDRNGVDVDADILADLNAISGSTLTGLTIADGTPTTFAVGAQAGFGAFTFGGSYAENDNDFTITATDGTDDFVFEHGDNSGWSLGMSYDVAGPWSVSFTTYQGETELLGTAGGSVDIENEAYRIGASRSLGTGVNWSVYALQSSVTGKVTSEADVSSDSMVIGTGFNLSF